LFAESFTSPSDDRYSLFPLPEETRGSEIVDPEIVMDWGSENAISVLLSGMVDRNLHIP